MDENRLSNPDAHIGEKLDRALRPQSFDDYIGQNKVKANLKVYVEAAKQRGEALDHVLLFGPPGLGKTTMAQILAREMGVGFRSSSGPILARAGDLVAILTNLEANDVLFIDEIHRLQPVVEEVLYPAMEDYSVDIIIGEGPSARSVQLDLQPFTLVGATTRAGLLANPLRDRFGIPARLEFYDADDLSIIVRAAAQKLNASIDNDGAIEIAKRARGTPRIAIRLLRRVRDFVETNNSKITKQTASAALLRLEVDEDGLDTMDRRYLSALINQYGGGPVGVETLAAALSEAKDALEDMIEPYLMQCGLLARTPRGRMATRSGWLRIGKTPPQEPGQSGLFDG